MPRTALPPKSSPPNDNIWRWSHRYWDIGETVKVGPDRKVTITRIKKNKYGRVSYYAGSQQHLLEELVPANHTCVP